jgi:hypothetical protein
MPWIATDVPDRPVALDECDAARVVAVPGTRRQDHLVNLGYHDRPLAYDPAQVRAGADSSHEPIGRLHLYANACTDESSFRLRSSLHMTRLNHRQPTIGLGPITER